VNASGGAERPWCLSAAVTRMQSGFLVLRKASAVPTLRNPPADNRWHHRRGRYGTAPGRGIVRRDRYPRDGATMTHRSENARSSRVRVAPRFLTRRESGRSTTPARTAKKESVVGKRFDEASYFFFRQSVQYRLAEEARRCNAESQHSNQLADERAGS